jgi:hypothetical protein
LAAALAAILAMAATTLGAFGGFDWFVKTLNPSYSEVAEPIGSSATDQGIRMEVIGASKYGNTAIVYISIQDVSGQNRLAETLTFMDYFSVGMIQPTPSADQEIPIDMSFSKNEKLLYFDKASNTLFYEYTIIADSNSLSGPLEIEASRIYYSNERRETRVPLKDVQSQDTSYVEPHQIFGISNRREGFPDGTTVLKPRKLAQVSESGDIWLSGVSYIDGLLHVQAEKALSEFLGYNFGICSYS